METLIEEVQDFEIERVSPVWLVTSLCVVPFCLYLLLGVLTPVMRRMTAMKVAAIYVYPIKSLREVKVEQAIATKYGFRHDRSFMLLQKTPDGYKNMQVPRYPEMTLFHQTIEGYGTDKETLTVTYKPPTGRAETPRSIRVPLQPDTEKLAPFEVTMHDSPTSAFKMPDELCAWFTDCFGYDVVLVYIGPHTRAVRFQNMQPKPLSPVLSFLDTYIPFTHSYVSRARGLSLDAQWRILFSDCAPYLVVSQTSLDAISTRLPPSSPMDVRKFRPNIVIAGAFEAFEEDLWGSLRFNDSGAEVLMAHNCVRCKSINVDFETGKAGTGPSGQVLKKMQGDRRIDKGARWSPVFGRYGFWKGGRGGNGDAGRVVRVGERVNVGRINGGPTVWDWPNLAGQNLS